MRKSALIFFLMLLLLPLQAQKRSWFWADTLAARTGFAPVAGNALEIISDGPYMLERLLEDVRSAQESIELEFYWIKVDQAGRQLREALVERMQAGVPVRIIVDNVTAPIEPVAFYDNLRKAGAELYFWTDPDKRLWTVLQEVGVRDHRKIAVIDSRICYTGGMNISNDIYRWADTQIRLEGPIARDLRNLFEQHWALFSDTRVPESRASAEKHGTALAQLLPSQDNLLEETFVKALYAARDYFWLRSPYFCPPDRIRYAMKAAAARGVDVRLMVPDKGDWRFMNEITKSYYQELLDAGIKVYENRHIYNHGKTFVSDDWLSYCGTVNLDERSFHTNFEDAVLFYDAESAAGFRALFLEQQAACHEITPEDCKAGCYRKGVWNLIRWFSPML